jgi:1-deoxy-D-xylulose-5-phosphate reductoisomerase
MAVAAFLERQIRFDQIHDVNRASLDRLVFETPCDLSQLLELDAQARRCAQSTIQSLTH